jgi:SpoVK/Ycf46/Vps4 family AAA+-type ATPase
MDKRHDLALILQSRTPIVVIESQDEARMLELLQSINIQRSSNAYTPLFRWTLTDGLQRLDIALEAQSLNSQPTDVLKHIRAVSKPGTYVLLDFHPFISDPVHVRLLKDICIKHRSLLRQIILISHKIKIPRELQNYCARFEMQLPSKSEREDLLDAAITEYNNEHPGDAARIDPKAKDLLVENLAGLTHSDAQRIARSAIYGDGAISHSDLPAVMQAKYELLNRGGALQFEYDTARFRDVGGLQRLKAWLTQRRPVFRGDKSAAHLDVPKGILLLGIQGCGKSLAAKATAGLFGVPLLRLDFSAIYDKYHGETERKLRESLKTADVMSPCVLWIDEIEKGIAGRGGETGTTQRVLGSFLTWMAERDSHVFLVATANDISALPPELIRKGRFDEIFFADLPNATTRASIFSIHLKNREQPSAEFNIEQLAQVTDGFSGAEIEQAVVSALYAAYAKRQKLATAHVLEEIQRTRPLSVVMREQVAAMRDWAKGRTVPCD